MLHTAGATRLVFSRSSRSSVAVAAAASFGLPHGPRSASLLRVRCASLLCARFTAGMSSPSRPTTAQPQPPAVPSAGGSLPSSASSPAPTPPQPTNRRRRGGRVQHAAFHGQAARAATPSARGTTATKGATVTATATAHSSSRSKDGGSSGQRARRGRGRCRGRGGGGGVAAAAKKVVRSPAPLTDIGCNLLNRRFARDRMDVMRRAWDANVTTMVITGCDMKGSAAAIRFVGAWHDAGGEGTALPLQLFSTVGVHPHDAKHMRLPEDVDRMRSMLQNPRTVAVGECGLDFNRNFSKPDVQVSSLHCKREPRVVWWCNCNSRLSSHMPPTVLKRVVVCGVTNRLPRLRRRSSLQWSFSWYVHQANDAEGLLRASLFSDILGFVLVSCFVCLLTSSFFPPPPAHVCS